MYRCPTCCGSAADGHANLFAGTAVRCSRLMARRAATARKRMVIRSTMTRREASASSNELRGAAAFCRRSQCRCYAIISLQKMFTLLKCFYFNEIFPFYFCHSFYLFFSVFGCYLSHVIDRARTIFLHFDIRESSA